MKSKLTELIKEAMQYADNRKDIGELYKPYEEYIAEYLMDNNTIVTPCKVGDVVYVVYKGGEYYWEAEVLAIWTRQDKVETDTTITVKFKDGTIDTFYSKEIYFTKEEAEKALKGEGK